MQATYEGSEIVLDQKCDHWVEDLGPQQVHIYLLEDSEVPVRVEVQTIDLNKDIKRAVPDVT